jgi:hypothetical protein
MMHQSDFKSSLFHRKIISLLSGLAISVLIFCIIPPVLDLDYPVRAESLEITPTITSENSTLIPTPSFGEELPLPVSDWGNSIYEVPLALTPHDHFYFTRPLSISDTHKLNVDYRYGYYYPEEEVVHTGIDIAGALGDPVLAAAAGKVIFAGYGLLNGANDAKDPYGLAVMIRHTFSYEGYTIYSVYAHLKKVTVDKGDWVETGDKIGEIGMTGNTSGPHVHFEIRIENASGDKVQNPELWIAPLVGHGVLAGRVETTLDMVMTTKNLWLKSLDTGKTWTIVTYAPKTKQVDDYYRENFTIGDLPVGQYEISTYYNWKFYKETVFIAPGTVNFVMFHGSDGFSQGVPEKSLPATFLTPNN